MWGDNQKYHIKAAFLVAGFVGIAGNRFDDSVKTFAQRVFDWQKIKENCQHFEIFHSDNDPYIRLEMAEELAKFLGVEVTLIPGAGHINESAGYTKFEELLTSLREIV